jgi:nucleoprotein TPR
MEIKALEEDNTRWKNRTHEILAKYDKIDPVEHRQLQENFAKLQQEATVQRDELTKAVDEKDIALKASEERVNIIM